VCLRIPGGGGGGWGEGNKGERKKVTGKNGKKLVIENCTEISRVNERKQFRFETGGREGGGGTERGGECNPEKSPACTLRGKLGDEKGVNTNRQYQKQKEIGVVFEKRTRFLAKRENWKKNWGLMGPKGH